MGKMLTDAGRTMKLLFAANRYGKQEVAIAALKGEKGASRANLFRAKSRSKGSRKSH